MELVARNGGQHIYDTGGGGDDGPAECAYNETKLHVGHAQQGIPLFGRQIGRGGERPEEMGKRGC